MGVFNPQMADMVIPMLEMMDFPGKDETLQKVIQGQQTAQLIQMLTQAVIGLTDRYEPEKLPALLQMLGINPQGGQPGQQGAGPPQGAMVPPGGHSPGFTRPNPEKPEEHSTMRKARERAQQASQPE